jgi:PAS domain S-box-containing protein
MKTRWSVALAGLLAVLAALAWLHFRQHETGKRVYRIGWALSPPFQVRGGDGAPTGLAVDLVNEAARRSGIKLEWVFWTSTSDSALTSNNIDLWPLITITPERLKRFHITEPYLESEYSLLVRDETSYGTPQDLATATIGIANPSIDSWQLQRHLPAAHPLPGPTPQGILADVCEQRSDAAFMDAYTAISAVLDQHACANHRLRWIAAPEIRSRLGIGATFAARGAAETLREELGAMASEGKLAPVLGHWGYMVGQNLASIDALLDARRHVARLTAAAVTFALLLVISAWQTFRFMGQRNHARRTEQRLRQTEQKLRLMGNNLKDMVLAYDMNRKLIYANPVVQTLTGYSVADLDRAGFLNWIHPDDQAKMLGRWDSVLRGEAFQDEEYRLVSKSGAVRWVAASWGPLLDETGAQVGVQGSERDITEHRALEEQYLQSQKLESVGRLAGGVAHDFNNLLTVINGYSDIVFRSLAADDPMRLKIEEIRKAGERAAELTRQLLVLSRKQVIQPRPLDLSTLVADSQQMFRRLLGETIELTTRLHPALSPVRADPGQMHQVLMNLLVNARDAMPSGGRVLIETANVTIDPAYVAGHPEAVAGPCVLLTVTDNGQGIDEESRTHIFEPFFTTKEVGKGTGLGLSTVYGIVKQGRGWIRVDSELGKGSTFRVYLPQIPGSLAASAGEKSAALPRTGSETLLVVEDQDEVRGVTIAILQHNGYKVLGAQDGYAALTLVERHPAPIHLLVTDVVMPGMNGSELARRLRRLRPEIRVLFTSGYTQDLIGEGGVLDREVAYLAKPFTPEKLAQKVREVLA